MTSMNQNNNQFENKFMNVVKCLLLTYLIQDLGIFNGRFLNGMYVYVFQDFVLIFMLLKQKICTKTFFFIDGTAFKSVFHFTTLSLCGAALPCATTYSAEISLVTKWLPKWNKKSADLLFDGPFLEPILSYKQQKSFQAKW